MGQLVENISSESLLNTLIIINKYKVGHRTSILNITLFRIKILNKGQILNIGQISKGEQGVVNPLMFAGVVLSYLRDTGNVWGMFLTGEYVLGHASNR